MQFLNNFINGILIKVKSGASSLPVIISIVLSIAFLSMLFVTIFTIVSMKRAEKKSKRIIDIPPSAILDKNKEEKQDKTSVSYPLPIGEKLNKYLIGKGYIKSNNIVKSFFKAMDYLSNSLGIGYKYKLPWYMIVGTESSGKSSLMSGFTRESHEDSDPHCDWWFLKNGIILDIKGQDFLANGEVGDINNNWDVMLNLLSRYRSARPLNGIILTIPATELYGKDKLTLEDISKRAQYISRKLSYAQSYIGLKLPIYVLITKTDVIPGFQSFCSEIPVRNRSNMLGWSSPYQLDIIYNSQIFEDGFSEFENELNSIRMEIFAENISQTTRDGIFVFPSELITIKSALKIYIDTIFKSSSEDRFFFRGFYFTGDSKMVPLLSVDNYNLTDESMAILGIPDANINEAGTTSITFTNEQSAPKRIFFFEDLLLKKVFAEDGLAAPIKTKLKQTNKTIMISKISTAAFVIIGSYGLFSANDQLKFARDKIYPSLFKISSLIRNADDLTQKGLKQNGNEILAECTSHLLSLMQQINSARLSSVFVPASWFSSINNELTETLRTSYQRVIVRTIYTNLIIKSKELLNMTPENRSESIAELLNPYNSKEYNYLKSYVNGLLELERYITKFDSLRTSADPQDLNDLIDYTFKGNLPKDFLDNYQRFRSILMNTPFPAINLQPYKQTAYKTLLRLFQNYLDAIFTNNSKNSLVSYLNRFVSGLTRQNLKDIPDCSTLLKFSKDLTAVCAELGKEGETWLDKNTFESDKEFDSLLDGVEGLFGKETAQNMLDVTAVNFGFLKSKLEEFNSSLKNDTKSKKINISNKKEKESLTSGLFRMEKCLSSLCSESFMSIPEDYKLISNIPEGKMIFWDDELVQYAYEIGQSYEQFAAVGIKDFPRAMQEGITLLAKSNMCAVITGLIAKSQSLVDAPEGLTSELTSEEILQKQVVELKTVAPKLVNLLKILRDDKFAFVFGNLRSILNTVGSSLLNHIDRLLDNQKPYIPGNISFNFWNGEIGAGLKAYSSSDIDELKNYLRLQRNMISRLGLDFAATIVDFLNSEVVYDKNYTNREQLSKWTRIVEALRSMEKRDPTSSITTLEKFIKTTLNTYNLDNITTKIQLKDISGESGDYFLNIIKEIKRGILSRAEILIRNRNIKRYESLMDYYKKHLDGKYPFANYDKTQRTTQEADLEAVNVFFKMYDEYGGTPEAILDQIYQLGDDGKPPYEFLKKVHDLKLFFGESLKKQDDRIKVRLEFRFGLNKREEKNTDYLVDKSFKPNGDTIIEEINKDKTGTWFFGEPMEFALRWADGDEQADKPTYDQNDPDIEIEGNTARIICVGNWSILRFIQKYKSTSNSVDNLNKNENLLTFRVPLSSGKIAKVSAGVTASLPKKPGDPSITTLKIPDTPGEMPEISEYVKSVANESVLVENSIGNVEVPDTDQDIFLEKTNEQQETDDNEEKDDVVEQEDEIEQHVEKQISNKKIKQQDNKQKKEAPKQKEKQIRKQSNTSKLPEIKQQTMDQQVDEILSSESIDEEPMIEISEQPIE